MLFHFSYHYVFHCGNLRILGLGIFYVPFSTIWRAENETNRNEPAFVSFAMLNVDGFALEI